jgi:N-acetyl-anhydromuramyl-L-alanine amidase AmpD
MVIDDKKYKLKPKNYIPIESNKTQIIIANTFNHDMQHVNGWLTRLNGNYKKTAPFTIASDGSVYKHFDPKYITKFFNDNNDLNSKSIVILLENDGFLVKNKENEFISFNGYIYRGLGEVVEKKWRGYEYWVPYTIEQIESLVELVCVLCDRFNIPLTTVAHNTKLTQLAGFEGMLYRSNLEKHYTDPNPNLDYELIKNKIESYERKY